MPDRRDMNTTEQTEATIPVTLPRPLYDRLMTRVEKLDISLGEWVATLIIEALDQPEPPTRLTSADEVPFPLQPASE